MKLKLYIFISLIIHLSLLIFSVEFDNKERLKGEKIVPIEIINNPNIQIVVEVMGGIEPAKSLIIQAIRAGKSVVTANKAVIARHGEEISNEAKAAGVYVLIEAAVGGGIPIIEPLKQSLGGNQITKVSGIINGTTNYILSRMDKEGVSYADVLKDAQALGYAESDPAADVEGSDAADKIAILSGLAFGGAINREKIPTIGINLLEAIDVNYARKLGYGIKLLAISEKDKVQSTIEKSQPISIWVEPTLVPEDNPLAGVNGVNNAILVEGNPIGQVMFFGPGAGSGPTASAVVADILNIAGIQSMSEGKIFNLDPLLSAKGWRSCHVAEKKKIIIPRYTLIAENFIIFLLNIIPVLNKNPWIIIVIEIANQSIIFKPKKNVKKISLSNNEES